MSDRGGGAVIQSQCQSVPPVAAGLRRRGLALSIDFVLILVVSAFVSLYLCLVFDVTSEEGRALGARLVYLVLWSAYLLVSFSTTGWTLGKWIVGIRVVRRNGQLSFKSGFVRVLGYSLSALPAGLGFWWVLWDPDGSTWHDRLSGTRVILAHRFRR